MLRLILLSLLTLLVVPGAACAEQVREAHLSIDRQVRDDSGKVVGWVMVFSAHLGDGAVRYWTKEGEFTDHRIPDDQLAPVKAGIVTLARAIVDDTTKAAGTGDRIQFGFSNQSGTISGLYFHQGLDQVPDAVADIVAAIRKLTGNG